MRKIVITIACTLLLAFGAIAAKNVFSCRIPIHNRGIAAAKANGATSALFLGSSTFRSNLSVDELDSALPKGSYILAYGGNHYVAADIQYDELKERGISTDLLVIELDPLLITEEVKLSDSRVIWDLSWAGKRRLWQSMSQNAPTFSLFWEYFVTSGMDDLITYPVTEPFYATRYHKGAKTDATASPGKDALEAAKFDISEVQWVDAQEKALFSLIDKCERDGQAYVLLESPHYHRLQDDVTYQKYREELLKKLDEKKIPRILATDVDFDNHEAAYFEDMGHMSEEGRIAYTKALLPLLPKN